MNLYFKSALSNYYGREKKFLVACSNVYYNLYYSRQRNIRGFTKALGRKFKVENLKCLKNELNPNSALYLQVLGSGAPGAPKSLFVHTSNHSFLFNCGEGMRRIANEGKRSISNINCVFITSNAYSNISGIPGVQEHVHRHKQSSFKTYGPQGLEAMMNIFSTLDAGFVSSVEFQNVLNDSLNFDDCIRIQAVPVYFSATSLGKTEVRCSVSQKENYVLSYICEATPCPGIVCTDKLVDVGVPPGPLVHQLKNGLSVTLPNGRIVSPQQVIKDSYEETSFVVVDIPSVDYLDSLISSPSFDQFKKSPDRSCPELIVHFTPSNVMQDPRYLEWVESFSAARLSHLIINDQNECFGLRDSLALQLKLNHINPRIFPRIHDTGLPPLLSPHEDNPNSEKMPSTYSWTDQYKFSGSSIQANNHLMYHFRPRKQFDSSRCLAIVEQHLINSCFGEEVVSDAVHCLHKNTRAMTASQQLSSEKLFPLITFLGTGSACPSPIRNVSAILINSDNDNAMLLDCGEGTFNQMIRLFGQEKAKKSLLQLNLIYISHHHRDHHLGLVTLLIQRQEAYREINKGLPTLLLLATTPVCHYLRGVHKTFYPILERVRLINNVNLIENGRALSPEVLSEVCNLADLSNLKLIYVPHCRNAFGMSFTHRNGWKITYSGDTMPCEELVKIGMNSDLLIHEASFENEMEEDAFKKRHSTVSQAIQAGASMKAKFTLLTHFSQRYYMIPLLDHCPSDVGIAFDFMSVTLKDLPLLPHFYPVFKELFYDSWEKMTSRTHRRFNIET